MGRDGTTARNAGHRAAGDARRRRRELELRGGEVEIVPDSDPGPRQSLPEGTRPCY